MDSPSRRGGSGPQGLAVTGQGTTSLEAARVLHETLQQLERVRRTLAQPFSVKANVDAALSKLEAGIKQQSRELLRQGMAEANQTRQSRSAFVGGATFRPKPQPLPPLSPSAAERVALFKADPVHKPQTAAARAYLEQRFGVAAPAPRISASERAAAVPGPVMPGMVARGITSTAAPGIILPKSLRDDPYASPAPGVTDMELEKGLFHLVNRGMLPARADLTPALQGGVGPVRMGGAPLYPHSTQFARAPVTSALEDSLLAAMHFKLDLLTPANPPSHAAATAGKVAAVNVGAQVSSATSQPGTRPGTQGVGGGAAGGDGGVGRESSGPGGAPAEDARTFDVLMDTFSLHEFMIRKGEVLEDTPEFSSYRRTYEPLWPVISALTQQLAALCKQYAIPLAVVDGKALADLAHGVLDAGIAPQMQDLLVCVSNIQEVAALLRQPGRRFMGGEGPVAAATTIQAAWRGHMARRKHSRPGQAAAVIQGVWRMHRLRSQLLERLAGARRARDGRFQELQRGLYTQWPLLTRTGHVVVHLPSMRRPGSNLTLEQMDAQLALEAAQLARLCDLAEPLAEVILLLPSPPDPDVTAYWDKLLEVGGVGDPSSRYRLVWPENHGRLPAHMSTAAQLLASPRALKRLRAAVQGRMGYIVPGVVGDEEVDLAVAIGLPLMAPAPYTAATLGKKSAGRTLFRAAGVHVAPGIQVLPRAHVAPPPTRIGPNGAEPLYPDTEFSINEEGEVAIRSSPPQKPQARSQYEEDEERVLRLLAEAMVRSPGAPKWLLKVDDEVGGAGHAWVDTLSVQGAADVLERTLVEECGNAAWDPAVPLSDSQQVAVYRMNELLYRQLPRKLQLAGKEVYPTYRDYISALAVRGGVIEACPSRVVGSPQANLFVDPQGNVSVLSTHERIFSQPYRAVGSTFPQTSVPHRALLDAAAAVGGACYRAGAIGHVAVDFVTLQEDPDAGGGLRLWAVDLAPFPTPSLMAFQLFDFLSVGSFNPVTGGYLVEMGGEDADGASASAATSATERASSLPSAATGTAAGAAAAAAASHELQGGGGQLLMGTLDVEGLPPEGPVLPGSSLLGPRPPTADLPSNLPSPRSSTAGTQGLLQPGEFDGPLDSARTGGVPSSMYVDGGYSSGRASSSTPGTFGATQEPNGANDGYSSGRGSPPTHRYFFALDAVHSAALCATPAARFFHTCWQEGLHFDVDHRVGVIFNLADSYLLGTLGIIAVGVAPHEMYASMQSVLAFITQREREVAAAAAVSMPGGRASDRRGPSVEQVRAFRELQALVKYMAEKSAAQAAGRVASLQQLATQQQQQQPRAGSSGSSVRPYAQMTVNAVQQSRGSSRSAATPALTL